MSEIKVIIGFLSFFLLGSSFAGAEASSREIVDDFIHNHCYDCHDAVSEKGEREFESLKIPLETIQDLVMAREIIMHPDFDKYDTSSLVTLGGGGAQLQPDLVGKIDKALENGKANTGYGMT